MDCVPNSTCTKTVQELISFSRQLPSSTESRILFTPSVNSKSYGERYFSYFALTLWKTSDFHSLLFLSE